MAVNGSFAECQNHLERTLGISYTAVTVEGTNRMIPIVATQRAMAASRLAHLATEKRYKGGTLFENGGLACKDFLVSGSWVMWTKLQPADVQPFTVKCFQLDSPSCWP